MEYADLVFDGVVLGKLPKITSVYGKEIATEGVIKAYMFVEENENCEDNEVLCPSCSSEEESDEECYSVCDESDISDWGEMTAQDGRLTFVTGIDF
jgi:hypothetical protein